MTSSFRHISTQFDTSRHDSILTCGERIHRKVCDFKQISMEKCAKRSTAADSSAAAFFCPSWLFTMPGMPECFVVIDFSVSLTSIRHHSAMSICRSFSEKCRCRSSRMCV